MVNKIGSKGFKQLLLLSGDFPASIDCDKQFMVGFSGRMFEIGLRETPRHSVVHVLVNSRINIYDSYGQATPISFGIQQSLPFSFNSRIVSGAM